MGIPPRSGVAGDSAAAEFMSKIKAMEWEERKQHIYDTFIETGEDRLVNLVEANMYNANKLLKAWQKDRLKLKDNT